MSALVIVFSLFQNCTDSVSETEKLFVNNDDSFNQIANEITSSSKIKDSLYKHSGFLWILSQESSWCFNDSISNMVSQLGIKRLDITSQGDQTIIALFYIDNNHELLFRSRPGVSLPGRYTEKLRLDSLWSVIDDQ